MKINLDDGYRFGIGLFETIHIYKENLLFLDEHLDRINKSIDNLNLSVEKLSKYEVLEELNKIKGNKEIKENEVLNIMVSQDNRILTLRDYTYKTEDFLKGFKVNISNVLRNETSIMTYNKTLNYAENILEKRKSINSGYNEPVFLNSKRQITEGATTNIFFVKDNKIFTPKTDCGLLNGIIREYIIKNYSVQEKEIYLNDIKSYDEIFMTNSLIGVMPVVEIGNHKLVDGDFTKKLRQKYIKFINA